jgi:hypothetical protein
VPHGYGSTGVGASRPPFCFGCRGRKAGSSSFFDGIGEGAAPEKELKNFCPFAGVNAEARTLPPDGTKGRKVFLVLFFQKKNCLPSCRLPSYR